MSACLSAVRGQHECISGKHASVSEAVSVSVCRHFAVCHIVLWNCCVFPQWRERRRNFIILSFLSDVLTERESLHLQESKRERKRGREERGERRDSPSDYAVQSVVKCSASKPNRSWKQKPFPKSHSCTPPPFLLSPTFLFFFSSLLSCSVLDTLLYLSYLPLFRVHLFAVAESSMNVKPANCDRHKRTKW